MIKSNSLWELYKHIFATFNTHQHILLFVSSKFSDSIEYSKKVEELEEDFIEYNIQVFLIPESEAFSSLFHSMSIQKVPSIAVLNTNLSLLELWHDISPADIIFKMEKLLPTLESNQSLESDKYEKKTFPLKQNNTLYVFPFS